MRRVSGLVVVLGYLTCGGACSGGYPLPPTRCDEFCDATKGFECEEFYQPAGCVSECEQNHIDVETCRVQFDAAVSCFRRTPGAVAARCDYSSAAFFSQPCQTEEIALGDCRSNTVPPNDTR